MKTIFFCIKVVVVVATFVLTFCSCCNNNSGSSPEKGNSSNGQGQPPGINPCIYPGPISSCTTDCESADCQGELVRRHRIPDFQVSEFLDRRVGPSFVYLKRDIPVDSTKDCDGQFLMQIVPIDNGASVTWTITLSTIRSLIVPLKRVFPLALMKNILADATVTDIAFSAMKAPDSCSEPLFESILMLVHRKDGAGLAHDYYDLSVPPDYKKIDTADVIDSVLLKSEITENIRR